MVRHDSKRPFGGALCGIAGDVTRCHELGRCDSKCPSGGGAMVAEVWRFITDLQQGVLP